MEIPVEDFWEGFVALVGAGAVYLALDVGLKFRAEIKKEKRGPEL